ncbi:MAG: GTP cyclohydrolase I FolE, partial [Firmicutes bacterium]|nr:GTP cyclohydrolase I FolE [Bacillota bacterium]
MDKKRIENAIREILLAIGEDPERPGLLETPARVARMYEEIYSGINSDPLENIKVFDEPGATEPVIIRNIPLYSSCEHHLMPFMGSANVAYIPKNGKILGLSKIARIVDILSRRPQLQERLCFDIAEAIERAVSPEGVAVSITAEHLCMTMRGIKKPGTKTQSY